MFAFVQFRKLRTLGTGDLSGPPAFRVIDTLKGANKSTQYLAVVGYDSLVGNQTETIKIEVSLREPLLASAINGAARTILRSPLNDNPMVAPVSVRCIDKIEALAEKFRAALSRREPAIRDFFDIDYAVRRRLLRPEANDFVDRAGIETCDPRERSGGCQPTTT